jgi:hypothetical protein
MNSNKKVKISIELSSLIDILTDMIKSVTNKQLLLKRQTKHKNDTNNINKDIIMIRQILIIVKQNVKLSYMSIRQCNDVLKEIKENKLEDIVNKISYFMHHIGLANYCIGMADGWYQSLDIQKYATAYGRRSFARDAPKNRNKKEKEWIYKQIDALLKQDKYGGYMHNGKFNKSKFAKVFTPQLNKQFTNINISEKTVRDVWCHKYLKDKNQ